MWGIWCRGIKDMLRLDWVRLLWNDVRHEYIGYPDFIIFFEAQMIGAAAERPAASTDLLSGIDIQPSPTAQSS
jgi:hypothetical protein